MRTSIHAPLLNPITLGELHLPNRVVMAPLTRRRATDDFVPTPVMAEYYCQRASAGLIIAEATNISRQAVGYLNSPGIFTQKQIEAWEKVTAAVHKNDGRIFLQLWHTGRVSHAFLQENGQAPVSSSAIACSGQLLTPRDRQNHDIPRALETSEIPGIVADYRQAALNAVEAGFDGVEIHGANGYLPDQFLHDGSNKRMDDYGGSIANRSRFILEITRACCEAIENAKVGIRLSPNGNAKDMFDSNPVALYDYLIGQLNAFDLSYLHLMEAYGVLEPSEKFKYYLKEVTPHYRKIYEGKIISNVNYTFESGNEAIEKGVADLIAFGKPFISNPDLVERFANNYPLSPWDKDTFYHGGSKGYIDYPNYFHQ